MRYVTTIRNMIVSNGDHANCAVRKQDKTLLLRRKVLSIAIV